MTQPSKKAASPRPKYGEKRLQSVPVAMLEVEAQYLLTNKTVVREGEFQNWVISYARAHEWLWHHNYEPRFAPRGFPDLVLLRPPEFMFVELKSLSRSGKMNAVSDAQMEWLRSLQTCGLETHLWTPADIPEILTRLRKPW